MPTMRLSRALLSLPLLFALVRCTDSEAPATVSAGGSGGGGSSAGGAAGSGDAGAAGAGECVFPDCWVPGDANGHADPAGAKAAGQARAGRITDASLLAQPVDARAKVHLGDFLLINDKISVVIEDKGLSDGYTRFGGDILSLDKVGADGKPMGLSQYGETLFAISNEMVNPDSVTVLNDGSDGRAAIVRVMGKFEQVPFFGGLASFFPHHFNFPGLYDFILEPGSEKLRIRLGVLNDSDEDREVTAADEMHGFFQFARSQIFTPTRGFDDPKGKTPWVAFDAFDGQWGFAWRSPRSDLSQAIDVSGFRYFSGKGFALPKGVPVIVDYAEVISVGPGLDNIRAGVARNFGTETEGRVVTGTLKDAAGTTLGGEGSWVHVLAEDGTYLSRARVDSEGNFTIHATGAVKLVPQRRGYTGGEASIGADATTAALAFAPEAKLHITARSVPDDVALPVRVQVIPETALPATPASYGVADEANGRLFQEFMLSGEATLPVPPGKHRVLISRGYEWEMLDTTVTAEAGKTLDVEAKLAHSVDSSGVLCADFHIHSNFSADAEDPVELKVKSGIADGLDILVSSEHDWIIDFGPVVQKLGMEKWSFGMPSEELTTFTVGHFGVIPLRPKTDQLNNGAFDWIGKNMGEVFDGTHALEDKPIVIVNHPSTGVASQGYFATTKFNRMTGKGADGQWSDHFDAVEVFNDSDYDKNLNGSVSDYYALLKGGKTAWMVGSSDSHHLATQPVGYPRTCLRFGHDDTTKLTPEAVRDAVAVGSGTISGGLLMEVKGPGGEVPGSTITTTDGKATFTIRVSAPSWVSADSIDAVVNGVPLDEPQKLVPVEGAAGPGKVFENTITVNVDQANPRNFVVFVARGEKGKDLAPLHPGRNPFAVSNPYFVKLLTQAACQRTCSTRPTQPPPPSSGGGLLSGVGEHLDQLRQRLAAALFEPRERLSFVGQRDAIGFVGAPHPFEHRQHAAGDGVGVHDRDVRVVALLARPRGEIGAPFCIGELEAGAGKDHHRPAETQLRGPRSHLVEITKVGLPLF